MRSAIVFSFVLVACGPNATAVPRCEAKLAAGNLVITEVFADYHASRAGTKSTGFEWFELYNATDRPIDLGGVVLARARLDGSAAKLHVMAPRTIAPGQYFVVGDATPQQLPAYVDYGYAADLGSLETAGTLAARCDGTEIVAVTYDHVKAGRARELTSAAMPQAALAVDPASWCDADANQFDGGNYGTPGKPNDCVPLGVSQCFDRGTPRDVVSPKPGDLAITEVMPKPRASGVGGEWFEIVALADIDLNGVGIGRVTAAKPELISSKDCVRVATGGYAVFARSSDSGANGGLPGGAIAGTFKFALATPGDLHVVAGATELDAIHWASATPGAALQLDPSHLDPISNDDPASFCDATMPYGAGDLGTPGAANTPCANDPPPLSCDDPDTSATRAIVKPASGALVITELMPQPMVKPGQEWFEIANVGTTPFDLNELGLDRMGDTRPPDVIHSPTCKSIPPGGFAVFARSAEPTTNGGLPDVDATFGFSMINKNGNVAVLDGDTLLDAATWSTSSAGTALQLDPTTFSATANDDPASFCAATTPYGDGSNLGTPRAANLACAANAR
jgi:hypothetical protein